LDQKTALYVQAVAAEENANVFYQNACDDYDGKQLAYGYAGNQLSSKRATMASLENVMSDAENVWQNSSDTKAVADANLRDLKAQYSVTFAGIDSATKKVDTLEAQLAQAKVDLANIPKPSAADKRRPKKSTQKFYADGSYLSRQRYVLNLK
jgi:hypothetical protein